KQEGGEALVVRLVETEGRETPVQLTTAFALESASGADGYERSPAAPVVQFDPQGTVLFQLRPNQIATLSLVPKAAGGVVAKYP
ncbi:MAG: glycosyl hydrolase-related protein, partial [Acidimicrobiales bacterium]